MRSGDDKSDTRIPMNDKTGAMPFRACASNQYNGVPEVSR
jgi:hypothetical protein